MESTILLIYNLKIVNLLVLFVQIVFKRQIWKPDPDMKMKTQKWVAEFQVYFQKSTVRHLSFLYFSTLSLN